MCRCSHLSGKVWKVSQIKSCSIHLWMGQLERFALVLVTQIETPLPLNDGCSVLQVIHSAEKHPHHQSPLSRTNSRGCCVMTTPAAVVMLPVWQRQSSDWPVLNWQWFRQLWPSCVRPEGGHLLQICCSVDAVAAAYCPALVVAMASWKVVDQSFCSLSLLSFTCGCSLIARYVAMGGYPPQQSVWSQQRDVMADDGLFSASSCVVWRASSMDRLSAEKMSKAFLERSTLPTSVKKGWVVAVSLVECPVVWRGN